MNLERLSPTAPCRRWWTSWAVLALAVGFSAGTGAQEAVQGDPLVRLWVEVRDAGGRVPADLEAGDLMVREGGSAITPSAIDPAAPALRARSAEPSRFVAWFDLATSSKATVRRAADGFLPVARKLTDLGDVELVMAGEEPEVVLTTRDELVFSQRLRWTSTNNPGEGEILAIRENTLSDTLRLRRESAPSEEIAARVTSGVDEEVELLTERLDQLVAWVGAQPRRGPRVLFLVTDGFDLDPLAFYGEHLDAEAWRAALRSTGAALALEGSVREASRALAALGWTMVPVAMENLAKESSLGPSLIQSTDQTGITTGGAGITIKPGSIFRRGKKDDEEESVPVPAATFSAPLGPLEILAEDSGGDVATNERALEDVVQSFARRFEVSYVSNLAAGADLATLDVAARQKGWVVRGPRWISPGVPESVAALRVRRLLRGEPDDGDLDVAAVLRIAQGPETNDEATDLSGELEARLQLRDVYGEDFRPDSASFRVTLGVAMPGDRPRVERTVVTGQNLTGLAEWQYRTLLDIPAGASEVAILVEDLAMERWGGTRAGVVSSGLTGEDVAPAPQVIELERPEGELLRGRTRFSTRVFDNRVYRVVFELDERAVAETTSRPFAARVDLGRSPRRQTLTVVAFDVQEQELGRDSVILNAGSGGLEVEIIRPDSFRGVGEVEVEASVAVPVERRLDRVLFFWNNEAIATLYARPFRQMIYIPPEKPVGYVRVVAMLDDGSVAEDVAFMNGPNAGERVDVNLVELYVVVTNKAGRPVRGLLQEDFQIRDGGRDQEISTFSDASDLPLTLGMAIDSSASMFVKLPTVQRAAIRFLRSTFGEEDRAFVVDFDSQPRLARSTTARLDFVERSIESLEASGRTALWESIVYSLVQLQGVRGRKALVVFSDGADEDDKFPYGSCMSFAKKMGVPIYLILMKKEPRDTAGLSLFTRSFTSRVDRLVEATGGRVFYAKEYDNLDEVYEDIEVELRSQYLLTYYPTNSDQRRLDGWRDVDVDVLKEGLVPRTLSGYWP